MIKEKKSPAMSRPVFRVAPSPNGASHLGHAKGALRVVEAEPARGRKLSKARPHSLAYLRSEGASPAHIRRIMGLQ